MACCSPLGPGSSGGAGGGAPIAYLCQANATDDISIPSAATPNQMLAPVADVADYTLVSDGRFALGANGLITYTGPDVQVLVRQTLCPFTSGVIAFAYGATAHNGDLVGQASTNNNAALVAAGAANLPTGAGDHGTILVSTRVLTLHSGDTLQPVGGLGATAGASDMTIMFSTLDVQEISTPLAA